jgi:hypothetical protein
MGTKNKKGPLGQDASHMGNPMKAFREGGEKRKAMYKHGGHNPPKGYLPKRFMGGPEDTTNPQSNVSVATAVTPYETKKQKILGIIPTGNTVQTRYGEERVWDNNKFSNTNFKEKQVLDKTGNIKKSTRTPMTDSYAWSKKVEPHYDAGTIQRSQGTTPYFQKKGGRVKSKKKG